MREGMLTIMMTSDMPSQSCPDTRTGGEGNMNTMGGGGSIGGERDYPVRTGALVCTFWCAVAMGGLLQGQPVESVSCSGDLSTSTAVVLLLWAAAKGALSGSADYVV